MAIHATTTIVQHFPLDKNTVICLLLVTASLVGNFLRQTLELALVAPVLADFIREAGDEVLVACRNLEDARSDTRRAELAYSDDTKGRRNGIAVEIGIVLNAGEHHRFTKEVDTYTHIVR